MHSLSALLDQQHIFRYIDYEVDRLIFALSIDLFSDSRFAWGKALQLFARMRQINLKWVWYLFYN